jgi:hypothetical protein
MEHLVFHFGQFNKLGCVPCIQVDFMEVVPGGWFMFMDVLQ